MPMPQHQMSVLAVDDDLEDLELIQEILLKLHPGIHFNIIVNGGQVLPYLDKLSDHELPGLIILDYNMPEITGAQLLSKLRTQPRYEAIPKVILSTSNAATYVRQCLDSGAANYFVKPDSMNEMRKTMEEILTYCKSKTN